MPFNLFINLVEEIAKPITLALRLFGNLLSGTLMLSLIAYLGVWKISSIPIGNVLVFFVKPSGSCSTWPSAASRPSSSPCSPSCTSMWP
jgi:hypothetical protein